MSIQSITKPPAKGLLPLSLQIAIAAVQSFFHHRGPQWAAAVAYYCLLSTFPLILGVAGISAYFADPKWIIEQAGALIDPLLPPGTLDIEAIVEDAFNARSGLSLVAIIALLWSGSRIFGTITIALNIAYHFERTYSYAQRLLTELGMLLSIGAFFLMALASNVLFDLAIRALPVDGALVRTLLTIGAFIAPPLLILAAFFLVYRYVPQGHQNWRSALIGALLATILFLLAKPLFFGYTQRFADYNLVYGSLTALVMSVVWVWVAAIILILGGEIASTIERIVFARRDPPTIL